MKPYMQERVHNPKWWLGLGGTLLFALGVFFRLKHGSSSATLLLGFVGLWLYCIWVARDRGSVSTNHELVAKNGQ